MNKQSTCAEYADAITRINSCSDIPLRLTLYHRGVKYMACNTRDPFKLVFFTDGKKKYVCSRTIEGENLVYNDCRANDDGTVSCYLDNPHFHPGRLHVKVYVGLSNENFSDGDLTMCKYSCLPIVITNGHGDDIDPSVSVEIALPYVEVSVYDAAVANGYTGTSEEFWNKFVGLMAGNSVSPDGAIRVVLASMGPDYDGDGVMHVLQRGECAYIRSRFQIAYMDNNGNITYYSPSPDLIYCNAYTNKLYRWNGSGWTLVGGGGESGQSGVMISSAAVIDNKLIITTTTEQEEAATVIVDGNKLIINNRTA